MVSTDQPNYKNIAHSTPHSLGKHMIVLKREHRFLLGICLVIICLELSYDEFTIINMLIFDSSCDDFMILGYDKV